MSRSRNKPTALFLGAGASSYGLFPTVNQFFRQVNFPKGTEAQGYEAACQEMARRISLAEGTTDNLKWPEYDAEKLLASVELLTATEAVSGESLPIRVSNVATSNPPKVLASDLLRFLKMQIVRIYGREVVPSRTQPPPHRDLLGLLDKLTPKDRPLILFTTNYDTMAEGFIRSAPFSGEAFVQRPRLCTGFTQGNPGRWRPELFDEKPAVGERLIHLLKLHGSVTWKWDRSSGNREPVEMNWREPTGETDCLLYFGYKSVPEIEPFKTLHNRLKDDLLDSAALVAIGFRFADPYIRETIDFALRANRELRVICCLKHDPEPNAPLWKLRQAFPGRVMLLHGTEENPIPFGKEGFLTALEEILGRLG